MVFNGCLGVAGLAMVVAEDPQDIFLESHLPAIAEMSALARCHLHDLMDAPLAGHIVFLGT